MTFPWSIEYFSRDFLKNLRVSESRRDGMFACGLRLELRHPNEPAGIVVSW